MTNKSWAVEHKLIDELNKACLTDYSLDSNIIIFDYINREIVLGYNPNMDSKDEWTIDYGCRICLFSTWFKYYTEKHSQTEILGVDLIVFAEDNFDKEHEEKFYKLNLEKKCSFNCSHKDNLMQEVNSMCIQLYYAEKYNDADKFNKLWNEYKSYVWLLYLDESSNTTVGSVLIGYNYSFLSNNTYVFCFRDIYRIYKFYAEHYYNVILAFDNICSLVETYLYKSDCKLLDKHLGI